LQKQNDKEALRSLNLNIIYALEFFTETLALPHLTDEDRKKLVRAKENLEFGIERFSRCLEQMSASNSELYSSVLHSVHFMLAGFAFGYGISSLSPSAVISASRSQAKKARLARQNSAQEAALTNAIKVELKGRDPRERGLAGRILKGVNQALEGAGHETVLRDVVGRRLKKMRS
jgi:hypothetical protein